MKLFKGDRIMQNVDKDQLDICLDAFLYLFVVMRSTMARFSKCCEQGALNNVRVLNLDLLPLYNIIIKASISGTLFLLLVYLFRCSPDFNDTIKDLIGRSSKRDRS